MNYKYDPATGEALYDAKTGEPIPDTVAAPTVGAPAQAFASPEWRTRMAVTDAKKQIVRGAFNAGRDVLAAPLSVAEGAVRKGGDVIHNIANYLVPGADLTGSSGQKWAPQGFTGAVRNAWDKRAEGVRGIVDNPINAASFIPALAPMRLARATGVLNPWLRSVIGTGIGATEGGLIGGIQAATEDRPVLPAAGIGAALGGGLSVAGQAMNRWGENRFPGLGTAPNPKVTEGAKVMVREALPDVLSAGVLPKGQQGFADLAEAMRMNASGQYSAAERAIPADWSAPVSDMEAAASEALLDRLAGRSRMAAEYDKTKQLATIPEGASEDLQAKFNAIRATQAHELQDPEWLNAEQLSQARTAGTDPRLYQNPVGSAALMAKDVGGAFHSALTDQLMAAPGYAEALGPNTAREYALAKSLGKVIAHPGRIGLGHRVPLLNLAIDPWLWRSGLYKTGNALQTMALPAAAYPGIRSGLGNAISQGTTLPDGSIQ